MNRYIRFAKETAFVAGQMLLNGMSKNIRIERKGEVNLVTEMDLESEKMIYSAIRKAFPAHSILAEEGTSKDTGSRYRWIVDPLDGTTNYAHRYPVWCVSVALEFDSEILGGVIYNPNLDEMFYGWRGKGAFMNRKRLHVSRQSRLSEAFLATGFPYDIRETELDNIDNFARFYKRCQAVRRGGSAALDLAYMAAGVFDGFWELKLSPWDTAAGKMLVEEAGGEVTDFSGNSFDIFGKEIVCANSKLLRQMLEVLKGN
jgi:myo-inositol-1(or 4)-monophosphatase